MFLRKCKWWRFKSADGAARPSITFRISYVEMRFWQTKNLHETLSFPIFEVFVYLNIDASSKEFFVPFSPEYTRESI